MVAAWKYTILFPHTATSIASDSKILELEKQRMKAEKQIPLRYSNKMKSQAPDKFNETSDVTSDNRKFAPAVLNKIQCLYSHLKSLRRVSEDNFQQIDNSLMNQFADLYESLKREIFKQKSGVKKLTTILGLFKKMCERLNADFLNYGETNVDELLGNFTEIFRMLKIRFGDGVACDEIIRYDPMQVRLKLMRNGIRYLENISCQKQSKEHYISKLKSLFDLHPNVKTFRSLLNVVGKKNMTVGAKLRKILSLSRVLKGTKHLKASKYETLKNVCKKTKHSVDTLKLLLDSFNGTYDYGAEKCNDSIKAINRKLLKLILYLILQKEAPTNGFELCYKNENNQNLIDALEVIDMKMIKPKIYQCLLQVQSRRKRSLLSWKKNQQLKKKLNATVEEESYFEQKDAKYHETLTRIRNINKLLSLFEPFGGKTSLTLDERTASSSNTNLDNLLKNVYESDQYHATKLPVRDKRSVNCTNNTLADPQQALNENETKDDSFDYPDEETEINSLENETKLKFIYLWERLFQTNLSSMNNSDESLKKKLKFIKSQIERNEKSEEGAESMLDKIKESFVLHETDDDAGKPSSQTHHYVETDLESDVNKPGESFAALLDHIKELIESLELSPANLKTITQLRFIAGMKQQPSEISIENSIVSRKRTKSIALADMKKSLTDTHQPELVTQKKVRRLMKTLNKLMQQINRIEKKRQKRNVNKKELVNFIKQFKFADRSNDMCLESPSETSYNGHRYTVLYGKKSVIPPHLIHDLKKADIAILYIQADTVLNIIQSFMGIASSNGIYYQIDKPLQIIQGVLEKFNKLTTVVIFYDSDPNNFFFKYLTYIEPAMNCATFIVQTVNRDWNPEKFDFHDMKQRGDRYVECGLKNMIVQKIYDTFSCRVEAQSKETFKESSTMRLEKIINKGLKKIFNEEILKQRSIKPLDVLNLVESYFNESSHKVKNFKGKCVDCFDSMKVERKTSYDSRKSGWLGEIFMHRDSSTSIDYPLVERYKRSIDGNWNRRELSNFLKRLRKRSTLAVDQEIDDEDTTEKKIWSDLIQDLKTRAKAIGVELIPLTSGITKKSASFHPRNYARKLRKRKEDRKSGTIRAQFIATRKKNMINEKENPNADSVPDPISGYKTKDAEKRPYFQERDETDDHVSNEGDIEDGDSYQERWKRSYVPGYPINEDLMPTLDDYLAYPETKDEEENFYTLLTMEEGANQRFYDKSSSTKFADIGEFNNDDYADKNDRISENGDLVPSHSTPNNTMDALENTNCAHESSEMQMDVSEGTASETYSENNNDGFGGGSESRHENKHFPNEDRSLETIPNVRVTH